MAAQDDYVTDNQYDENYLFDIFAYDVTPEDEKPSNAELEGWQGFQYYEEQENYIGGWEGFQYYETILNPNPLNVVYSTYAGTDIVAEIVVDNEVLTLGELQTISYSIHRENVPVRILGHVNPISFVRGPRTIAGSLIFTVFNYYAFYRLKSMRNAIEHCGVYAVADMIPPFDMVLTFSNESGALSKMRILGVQIIDEGGTMSVDDLVTEQTYSFMARGIQPMTGYAQRSDYEIDVLEGPRDVSRLQV